MTQRFAIGILALFASSSHGQVVAPSQLSQDSVRSAAKILPEKHFSRQALDTEIATRWVQVMLKDFDEAKVYLTKADVEIFARRPGDYAALFRGGEPGFVLDFFNTYRQRRAEAFAYQQHWLKQPIDFEVAEEIQLGSKVDYPADAEAAKERWRQRVKLHLLDLRANGLDDAEARARLGRRYQTAFDQIQKASEPQIIGWAINALATAFDSRSGYRSPAEWKKFVAGFQTGGEGIGAQLRVDDGTAYIVRILPGGAAQRDGKLQADDRIVGIGQATGPIQDVIGSALDDIVALIKGPRGTQVRLEILRPGQKEKMIVTLTRDRFEQHVTFGEVLPAGDNKILYIHVPSLYGSFAGDAGRTCIQDVAKLLRDHAGTDLVLLDLRTNTGGVLSQAIGLTGLFLNNETVVQTKFADGTYQRYTGANKEGTLWKKPVVVLMSRETASGCEILAGALQNYGRALLVGEKSAGSGLVSNFFDVETGSDKAGEFQARLGVLQLTTQVFYRPLGEAVQKRAIVPDVELPWLTNHDSRAVANDPFALDAKFADNQPLKITTYDLGITIPQVTRLIQQSDARVKKSDGFQKAGAVRHLAALRAQSGVATLNLKKHLAERALIPDSAPTFRKVDESRTAVRDYYLEEVLEICTDYLGQLREAGKIPAK